MYKSFIIACMLLTIIFSFARCKKVALNDAKLAYGTSFGMCAGFCVKELQFTETVTTFTASTNGSNPNKKTCSKPTEAGLLELVRTSIDPEAFRALPEVIGCPDCADGGKEWIEISYNGQKHRVAFDYSSETPAPLKKVVEKLRTVMAGFNDCQ